MLIALLFFTTAARAHVKDTGYAFVRVEGREASLLLELTTEAVEDFAGFKDGELKDDGVVRARLKPIFGAILGEQSTMASGDGVLCPWERPAIRMSDRRVYLEAVARCPATIDELEWTFPSPRALPAFQLLGTASFADSAKTFTLESGREAIRLTPAGIGLGGFLRMGMRHIGAWPSEWRTPSGGPRLADGIDHILFVVALVLGGGGVMGLLGSVTGFTLGHSITLALASLGFARMPSRLVESAIALSIMAVAADDLVARLRGHVPRARFLVAALFGLIHGFGFATALAALQLSRGEMLAPLVGFNVGVELGQLSFVILIFPLILLVRRFEKVERIVVPGGAWGVLAAGTYWFVVRALGL